jgi:hypothetical protein
MRKQVVSVSKTVENKLMVMKSYPPQSCLKTFSVLWMLKGEVSPVPKHHAMEACRGHGGKAPRLRHYTEMGAQFYASAALLATRRLLIDILNVRVVLAAEWSESMFEIGLQ